MELPEQRQTVLSGLLQTVLFDEELLVVLEQVVRSGHCHLVFWRCGWARPLGIRLRSWDKIVLKISTPPLNPKVFFSLNYQVRSF